MPPIALAASVPAITLTPPDRVCFPTPPLPASEYLDVPGAGGSGSRQRAVKQNQKEAEKRAKKEAREAEKHKALWEKGQREREKAVRHSPSSLAARLSTTPFPPIRRKSGKHVRWTVCGRGPEGP